MFHYIYTKCGRWPGLCVIEVTITASGAKSLHCPRCDSGAARPAPISSLSSSSS